MRYTLVMLLLVGLGFVVSAADTNPVAITVGFTPDATSYGPEDTFTVSFASVQNLVPAEGGLYKASLHILFGNKFVQDYYLHAEKDTLTSATSAVISVSPQVISDYLDYCIRNEPSRSKAELLENAYIQVVLLKEDVENNIVGVFAVGNSHQFAFIPAVIKISADGGDGVVGTPYKLAVHVSVNPVQSEHPVSSVDWGDGTATTPVKDESGLELEFGHIFDSAGTKTVIVTTSVAGVTTTKAFTVLVLKEKIHVEIDGEDIATLGIVTSAKLYKGMLRGEEVIWIKRHAKSKVPHGFVAIPAQ